MWELIVEFIDGRRMHRPKLSKSRCDSAYKFLENEMLTFGIKSVTKRLMEA